MTKLLVVLSLLMGGMAYAEDNVITCSTTGSAFGKPTDVTLTIDLSKKLPNGMIDLNIQAQGMTVNVFNGGAVRVHDLFSLAPTKSQVTYRLLTTGGIVAELSLNVTPEEDRDVMAGAGTINISKSVPVGFPLSPVYSLNNCQGHILKN